jgi:hypothetical protein
VSIEGVRRALLAIALAALVAGCGGSAAPVDDAAQLVPANAIEYLTVATRPAPIGPVSRLSLSERLHAPFAGALALARSLPAAGRQVDLAVLHGGGTVGFARPANPKRFAAQLERRGFVARRMRGWTVFARTKALLDALRHGPALADRPRYRAAAAALPGGDAVLARAYATPGAAPSLIGTLPLERPARATWLAAALSGTRDDLKVELHANGARTNTPSTNKQFTSLAAQIPAGSLLALSSARPSLPGVELAALQRLATPLQLDVAALLHALGGPFVAFVRAGAPIPEVTIAATPRRPRAAVAAIAKLVRKLAGPAAGPAIATPVAGGTLRQVDLGPVAISYGEKAGVVVLSDSSDVLAELDGGPKLAGDGRFRDTAGAAGLPEGNDGFAYLDAAHALPAAETFAALAGSKLPAGVAAGLEHLEAALLYTARGGDVQTSVVYLRAS